MHAESNSAPPPTPLPAVTNNDLAPADVLQDSALLPSQSVGTRTDTGGQGIERGLSNQTPLPVSMASTPGSYTSFRGLGRSADEVNFQAFGVPLNGPQGGGYDLSIFPQYLWSEYRYQSGPSLGSFDPRASAGTVSLVPWTQKALQSKDPYGFRFQQTHAFGSQSQISLGGHSGGAVAAMLGYSDGYARGPSGSLSTKWTQGRFEGRMHFLGTDLNVRTPGSRNFPTPQARQVTTRLLPVVQGDYVLSDESRVKTSFFYDTNSIQFSDPDSQFSDTSHAQQIGADSVLIRGPLKLGAGMRYVTYETTSFASRSQTQVRLQGSRIYDLGIVELEPLLQGLVIQPGSVLPEAALTTRREWTPQIFSTHARVAYSKRVPTMVDLYYRDPWFVGNANLTSETVYTGLVGADWKLGRVSNSVQTYVQSMQDAIVPSKAGRRSTLVNSGSAWIASAMHTIRVTLNDWCEVSNGLNWTNSAITRLGTPYPYLPMWTSLLNGTVHALGDDPKWSLTQTLRTATGAPADSGHRVGGYTLWDMSARLRIARIRELTSSTQSLYVGGRIENVLGRKNIELVRDYPLPGRTWIANLTAEF